MRANAEVVVFIPPEGAQYTFGYNNKPGSEGDWSTHDTHLYCFRVDVVLAISCPPHVVNFSELSQAVPDQMHDGQSDLEVFDASIASSNLEYKSTNPVLKHN
ncbi:hypothetical protein A0H81_12810 [Grifola frondosa]|uniref:Uncharacterized protein n=1 Tax=Grifola frondosa TaxID=5627 RepID=A0A1C7LR55_GRIFR|nr:hypothetical protein A0H81_12810 [Grifola frondosa]